MFDGLQGLPERVGSEADNNIHAERRAWAGEGGVFEVDEAAAGYASVEGGPVDPADVPQIEKNNNEKIGLLKHSTIKY